MTIAPDRLRKIDRTDDLLERQAGGNRRGIFGRWRPLLEKCAGLRIDGRGILPVLFVQIEHVSAVETAEFLPTGHVSIILTHALHPSRGARASRSCTDSHS